MRCRDLATAGSTDSIVGRMFEARPKAGLVTFPPEWQRQALDSHAACRNPRGTFGDELSEMATARVEYRMDPKGDLARNVSACRTQAVLDRRQSDLSCRLTRIGRHGSCTPTAPRPRLQSVSPGRGRRSAGRSSWWTATRAAVCLALSSARHAPKRMGRVRAAHPLRPGPSQLLGPRGIRVGQDIGRCREEPLHDRPQSLGGKPSPALEAAE